MKFQIMPYAKIEGKWTIPDDAMKWAWYQMLEQNRAYQTFYDASVRTAQGFIEFMQDSRNLPVFIFDEKFTQMYMVAWLNDITLRTAQSHFCCIGKYHRGMAEAVTDYWSTFKHTDKRPLFLTIIGLTPATYTTALKLLKIAKYIIIGKIPNACFMADQGEFIPGIISYYCPKEA